MAKIYPLSKNKLDEAISLVAKIFPDREDRKIARINLEESLFLKNSGKWYWVAADKSGKLVGVTGLYLDAKDEDVIWLGWFGVHPEYRRLGIGSCLLEYTSGEAKRRGFNCLKIYTSLDNGTKAARSLYELHGFSKIKFCKDVESIYYIKNLETGVTKAGSSMKNDI
jgi:GNAT superfamily N-acetyltransferase